MQLVGFDLDGTLADNEGLVRRAYADVGVVMPEDSWGQPWQEWLDDPILHHKKNTRYMDLIDAGLMRATTAAEFVVKNDIKAVVLTGASTEAATAVLRWVLPSRNFVLAGSSMTHADKLQYIEDHYEIKSYVDDDESLIMKMRNYYGTPNDKFTSIHYRGQTVVELERLLLS